MTWWHGPGMTPWGYALTTVSMVLFLQLAVFGVIVLIRYLGRLNQSVAERPLPRMLVERFARSELDGQKYRQRLDTLRGPQPAGHEVAAKDPQAGVTRLVRAVGSPLLHDVAATTAAANRSCNQSRLATSIDDRVDVLICEQDQALPPPPRSRWPPPTTATGSRHRTRP